MEEKKRKKEERKEGWEGGREGGRENPKGQRSGGGPRRRGLLAEMGKKYLTERRKPARALQGGLGLTYKVLQVARTSKTLLFQNAAPKAPLLLGSRRSG